MVFTLKAKLANTNASLRTHNKKRQATRIRCRIWSEPLWCLRHDPNTELVIKAAHAPTFTHTNIPPSVSLAALQWTHPPSSLTSPSSAISFVFGQMRCSGPGGSSTVCGAITQKQSVTTYSDFLFFSPQFFVLQPLHKIWAQQDGFLWIYFFFFSNIKT